MIEAVKKLLFRFKTELAFLIAGVMTTVVNYIVFFLLTVSLRTHYLVANVASWVVAVLFAYFVSRVYVFRSKNKKLLTEFWFFTASRLFSLMLETALLFIAVDALGAAEMLAKAVVAVAVIVCNYLTGKWFVFKK